MAWIFNLGVECGPSEAGARLLADHFDQCALTLGDGRQVRCSLVVNPDGEGNWWVGVFPHGMRAGGPGEVSELRKAERLSEAARQLYTRLEHAPPFRYALVGVEALDFRHFSELDRDVLVHLPGLVVSDKVWAHLGSPAECAIFRPGYRWVPYAGEADDL